MLQKLNSWPYLDCYQAYRPHTKYHCTALQVTFNELDDDDLDQRSRSQKVTGNSQMFPKTKLLSISLMLFALEASYLELMYNTVRDC